MISFDPKNFTIFGRPLWPKAENKPHYMYGNKTWWGAIPTGDGVEYHCLGDYLIRRSYHINATATYKIVASQGSGTSFYPGLPMPDGSPRGYYY